jgi:uncharacterized damage-inducible protein DinB
MTELDRIADQFRRAYDGDAWHGTPLRVLLADVPPEHADARPIAGAHTLRELVFHLTVWLDVVRRRLEGEAIDYTQGEDWHAPADPDPASWPRALAELDRTHAALLDTISALDPATLDRIVPGKEYDGYVLLHGAVQHNLYHAGQVAIHKKAIPLHIP